jgi:hypothetical protein
MPPILTILITVVSGKESVRRILTVLYRQTDWSKVEIIVPFDKWSQSVGELASEFPEARFHFIEDLGLAASANISGHQHRLYDRRRAVGLQLSQGRIIAMTEDHAKPAEDWVCQILTAHKQPFEVIGGAIENGVDAPLNWAWYYCDFGRYGRPLADGEIEFVSDVNVAYKRDALMAISDVWCEAYHETSVHWAMKKRGIKLVLDEKMVVYQQRPKLSFGKVWKERIEWGRIFAETRVKKINNFRRLLLIATIPFLPTLLLARTVDNMRRQKKTVGQIIRILPLTFLLLLGWSFGELIGYVFGEPNSPETQTKAKINNIHTERVA